MTTYDLVDSGQVLTMSLLTDLPSTTDPSHWPYLTVRHYAPQQAIPVIFSRLAEQIVGFMSTVFPQIGYAADQVKAVGVTFQGQYVFFAPVPAPLIAGEDLPISVSFVIQHWSAP